MRHPSLWDRADEPDTRPATCGDCGQTTIGTPEHIEAWHREHWRLHHGRQPHALELDWHRPSEYEPPIVDRAICSCRWRHEGPTTMSAALGTWRAHLETARAGEST